MIWLDLRIWCFHLQVFVAGYRDSLCNVRQRVVPADHRMYSRWRFLWKSCTIGPCFIAVTAIIIIIYYYYYFYLIICTYIYTHVYHCYVWFSFPLAMPKTRYRYHGRLRCQFQRITGNEELQRLKLFWQFEHPGHPGLRWHDVSTTKLSTGQHAAACGSMPQHQLKLNRLLQVATGCWVILVKSCESRWLLKPNLVKLRQPAQRRKAGKSTLRMRQAP